MGVTLHWDGTSGRGIESAPICVGVANTNDCDSTSEFCIAYMPHIPDWSSKEFRDSSKSTDVKWYIRDRCAASILHVLETAACSGVKCRLLNTKNMEIERLLFPKLFAMNFDQPEAQLFFGLQNKQSCSRCFWRKGYSAFRRSREHTGSSVRLLYKIANDPSSNSATRKHAREKLERWGFNHQRE